MAELKTTEIKAQTQSILSMCEQAQEIYMNEFRNFTSKNRCQLCVGFFPRHAAKSESFGNCICANSFLNSDKSRNAKNTENAINAVHKLSDFTTEPNSKGLCGVIISSSDIEEASKMINAYKNAYEYNVVPRENVKEPWHRKMGYSPVIYRFNDGSSFTDTNIALYDDGILDFKNESNMTNMQKKLMNAPFISMGIDIDFIHIVNASDIKDAAEFSDSSRYDFRHVIAICNLTKDDAEAMEVLKKRTESSFITFVTTTDIDSIPEEVRNRYIIANL